MRPNGVLRKKIEEVALESGAYVLVSSGTSTTARMLKNRIEAMEQAVTDAPNSEKLHLDFLDRGRIATWVRTHPSLILWVREKIGRPLQGWQPYRNWANPSADLQEEYVIDDELRFGEGVNPDQKYTVLDGLQLLRLQLLQAGKPSRLVGLSGVGKTRFVQALFDERLGEHALPPSHAYYTDISDSPIPEPLTFAG